MKRKDQCPHLTYPEGHPNSAPCPYRADWTWAADTEHGRVTGAACSGHLGAALAGLIIERATIEPTPYA